MESLIAGDFSIWFIVKIFIIIALFLYLVFALVVIKQVQMMLSTIEAGLATPLKFLSYIHLLFAVVILIIAIVTL
jgi:hypothetical protein